MQKAVTQRAFVMTRICDSFFLNAMATCLFGSVSGYVAYFFGSPIFLVVQYICFFQCQMLSFPEVPKEKGTLILPVEEIVIIREPPKYVPPTLKLPFDDPTRPALVFELQGVLCRPYWDSGSHEPPDLDVTSFDQVEESKDRSMLYY